MKYLLALLMLIFFSENVFASNLDILNTCRPEAVFNGNSPININTRESIMENYSGNDFPDQNEWNDCIANYALNKTKNKKIIELNEKGREHICRVSGLCYGSWEEMIIAYHDYQTIAPAARQPTASKLKAIEHYQPWSDARDTINNYTGISSVQFFNVSTMVAWP